MAWSRSITVAEGILAGSPALECEFAERFLPRVKTFFRARSTSADVVEELTQETIVAALIALRSGRLREYEAMESFVLGIARRLLAGALRAKAKDPASPAGDEIELALGPAHLSPELRLTVRGELDELEETDRRILWLILVEGFRPAEVAGKVGLSEEAVRQRKSRLLRRLAEKFNSCAVTNGEIETTLSRKGAPGDTP